MKYRSYIFSSKLAKVVFILAVFGLLFFLNPYNFFNPVRAVFLWTITPIQKITCSVAYKVYAVKDFFASVWELKQENNRLIKENLELLSKNAKLSDMEKENIFLREQVNLLPREKYTLIATTIISRDPYNLENWVEIDKGEKDGVQKEMLVIVSNGILLGKVAETNYSTSKIILITNPDSIVNALDIKTDAKGVLKGQYGLGLVLDMILPTETVNVGDEVISSGLGGLVPRGLLIGKVQEVKMSQDKLFQRAIVVSPVNFSNLRQLFIIKEFNR